MERLFIASALFAVGHLLLIVPVIITIVTVVSMFIQSKHDDTVWPTNKQTLRFLGWVQVSFVVGMALLTIAYFMQSIVFLGLLHGVLTAASFWSARMCFKKSQNSSTRSQKLEQIRISQADDDDSWNPNVP